MDYDDNDFHSQNFQLVGEDNNKFPSGLRSFSLPKIDLDEHLQVHIRFDSLVEPESLLGIQSQDESNWIEGFSAGSTELEFSTSAAESCPISRCNNVWSEATSSESVEMLLKSVGEDDMIKKRMIVENSDSREGLGGVNHHMDPVCGQDDTHLSEVVDIKSDPAVSPSKCPEGFSGSMTDATGVLLPAEDMLKTFKDEELSCKQLKVLDLVPGGDVVAEQCGLNEKMFSSTDTTFQDDRTKQESLLDKNCHEIVHSVDCLDGAFIGRNASDDHASAASVVAERSCDGSLQIDPSATSISVLAKTSDKCSQKFVKQVPEGYCEDVLYGNSEGLVTDDSQEVESLILHKGGEANFQPSEVHAIKSCPSGLEKSPSMEPKVESSVLLTEGYNKSVVSTKSDGLLEEVAYNVKLSSKGSEVGCQIPVTTHETPFLVIDGERNLEGSNVEICNADTAKLSTPAADMNSLEQARKGSSDAHLPEESKVLLNDDGRCVESVVPIKKLEVVDDYGGRKPETYMMVMEEKQDSESCPYGSINGVENPSSVAVIYNLTNTAFGPRDTDKEEGNLGIHPPGFTSPGPVSAGIQRSAEDEVLKNDGRNLEGALDSQNEIVMENVHSPKSHTEDGRRVQISPFWDARSSEMCNAVPLEIVSCDMAPMEVSAHEKGCAPTSASSVIMDPVADVSLLKEKSQDALTQSENTDAPLGGVERSPAKKSIPTESVVIAGHSKVPMMPASPSAEKSSPSICQNKREGDEADIAPGIVCSGEILLAYNQSDVVKCKENSLQSVTLSKSNSEPHSLEAGSDNPNSFEPNCGSPTVISCREHSHDNVKHQLGNQGLSNQTVPVSGNSPQISSIDGKTYVNKSSVHDPKKIAFEDDRSFTFEVGSLADLSGRETGIGRKPFPNVQSYEQTQTRERPSAPSGLYRSDLKVLEETSCGSPLVSVERTSQPVVNKNTSKDKSKPKSGSSTEKSASKRKAVKETSITKQTVGTDGNPCSTPVNSVGKLSRDIPLEEMRQYSYIGGSMTPSCAPTVQTSKLPDLNSAAALFHQPFTDSQQVQLRAQIFVYGSLIQGIPPDEAFMISAFGNIDGGRSAWEGVWRVNLERFHNLKSPINNCETPLNSRSGIRVPEQVSRSTPLESTAHNTPASRTIGKGAPPAIFTSTVSLPSPLWSISTPREVLQSNVPGGPHLDSIQMFSPLHGHQSSFARPYAGSGNPWLSKASSAPWVASSQTPALGTSSQFSALPIAETVQVTPIRDSSVPYGSSLHLVSSSSFPTAGSPLSVTAATAVQLEPKRKTVFPGLDKSASTDQKTRKRKKGIVSEAPGAVLPASQTQTELDSATVTSMHLPTSTAFQLPANLSTKVTSGNVSIVSPNVTPTLCQIMGIGGNEQKIFYSEETCSKIEQAKLQAEDASASAAMAIKLSEGIWSQLAAQKNSGMLSEIQMKLASAAAAAAAAASVAKAAAAAAKVASDAALQAKLMADEALISTKTGNFNQCSQTGHTDAGINMSKMIPVSILKGKNKINGSSSVISAAKEGARKRVEAASAATKRAENLDAIVKAAELAAEAVSQAGAIIAIGDPLPFTLSDLIEAGPDSYWKAQHSRAEHLLKTSSIHREELMTLDSADGHNNFLKSSNDKTSEKKEIHEITDAGEKSFLNENSNQSMENYKGDVSALASSAVPTSGYENNQTGANQKENTIQEGSLVEVVSNEDGLRGIWFSARVLYLKDGKAYVCYNELQRDEGSDKTKQWIPLEDEGDKAPRIRIAHPMTAVKYEGTRKRRRSAAGNYEWAIGDRVDARIRDGWWEGIVTEKSKEDETKLTIHFPARGGLSSLRVWNLRPSFIWNGGQWVEWSRPRENTLQPHEGDTPQDKRQKLVMPEGCEAETIGADKLSRNLQINDSGKPEELRPLVSAKEKIFSVGKNTRGASNSEALRIKRTGLQKEGARVIFGVPKPGKKRKFMEVSKHYVTDKPGKISEGNDSIKFANYLMPQAARGWKNAIKVEFKGKQAGDPKPKMLKPIRSQNIQTRNAAEKESSAISSNGLGMRQGPPSNIKASSSLEEKSEKNMMAVGSISILGTAESTILESPLQPLPGAPSSKKKTAFAVEAEVGAKGKVTSVRDNSAKNEEKDSKLADHRGKAIPDAPEPRRSNRRIQPTSRLLEGLQSSLIIAKIPSVSQDKGTRYGQRNVSTPRGNTHG